MKNRNTKRKLKRRKKSTTLARSYLHKKKHYKGGSVSLHFDKPKVSATTSRQAIQTSIHQQNNANAELTELTNTMAGGGGIVVPQMDQAGDSGNDSIKRTIGGTLQARADGEFDSQVYDGQGSIPQGSAFRLDKGGGKRRRRRTKKRKKRRIKRKKRRTRRKKCSKCPYRCCMCCKCKKRRTRSCCCRKCPKKCCPCCSCKRKHPKRKTRKKKN
tara:strand:+ start:319 stop:960 length:642 start_codon:yes stop_codon:yes gene_type:complete